MYLFVYLLGIASASFTREFKNPSLYLLIEPCAMISEIGMRHIKKRNNSQLVLATIEIQKNNVYSSLQLSPFSPREAVLSFSLFFQ